MSDTLLITIILWWISAIIYAIIKYKQCKFSPWWFLLIVPTAFFMPVYVIIPLLCRKYYRLNYGTVAANKLVRLWVMSLIAFIVTYFDFMLLRYLDVPVSGDTSNTLLLIAYMIVLPVFVWVEKTLCVKTADSK